MAAAAAGDMCLRMSGAATAADIGRKAFALTAAPAAEASAHNTLDTAVVALPESGIALLCC